MSRSIWGRGLRAQGWRRIIWGIMITWAVIWKVMLWNRSDRCIGGPYNRWAPSSSPRKQPRFRAWYPWSHWVVQAMRKLWLSSVTYLNYKPRSISSSGWDWHFRISIERRGRFAYLEILGTRATNWASICVPLILISSSKFTGLTAVVRGPRAPRGTFWIKCFTSKRVAMTSSSLTMRRSC